MATKRHLDRVEKRELLDEIFEREGDIREVARELADKNDQHFSAVWQWVLEAAKANAAAVIPHPLRPDQFFARCTEYP